MGMMKEVVNRILDLLENGYDVESIALIAGVDESVVKQVQKKYGIDSSMSPEQEPNDKY